MNTTPLLLGICLMFWGWQTEMMFPAVVIAVIVEGSRLVAFRLDLKSADFNRISDICAVILLCLFAYLFFTYKGVQAVLLFIQWLPLMIAPILAAQLYSMTGKIDGSALLWSIRKGKGKGRLPREMAVNITYPYFALTILSASAANKRTLWFYLCLLALTTWGLWPFRSRRFSWLVWGTFLLLAGSAGYIGQVGLHRLQDIVGDRITSFLVAGDFDPYRSTTAIGDVGTLKLSNTIIARVKPDPGSRPPTHLRTASYDTFRANAWYAPQSRFQALQPGKTATWKLDERSSEGEAVTIYEQLKEGKGVLKVPLGASVISDLPVGKVDLNRYGAIRVQDGPGLIGYHILYKRPGDLDAPPTNRDLDTPKELKADLETIVQDLSLSSLSPANAVKTLDGYFQQYFNYSLLLGGDPKGSTVHDFLTRTKAGHCEYFATATVLILRAARIPARYAVGYAVDEYSPVEKSFIIRDRHAHAWSLAYVDGSWCNVDTTPSSWIGMEKEKASLWEPISDFFSWCLFRISLWRWGRTGIPLKPFLWALLPLALLLAFRFLKTPVKRLKKDNGQIKETVYKPGLDSEFYLIEQTLSRQGYPRQLSESLADWRVKIKGSAFNCEIESLLEEAFTLHYRLRFDPQGLSPEERKTLGAIVHQCLDFFLLREV